MEIRTVGVVGLGTMGAGIAEVFARGGLEVTAVEADSDALARGLKTLDGSLARSVAKGRLTEPEREEIRGRVTAAQKYADLATADLVVEVVPERLEIKRQVLGELDQACRADTIIATNTSSLSVTTIAAGSAHPGRVVGLHFFNPAPVMRLVEVVTTVLTEPPVAAAVSELASRLGKTPVRVTDRAGFIANALLLPYLNHAVRLLETGYATREDIDTAMTVGIGLPMGPLTLLDLIGLDTSLSVLEVLEREFGGPRYKPAPLLRRMVDAGRTGRKSGQGFYDYQDQPGQKDESPDLPAAPGTVTLIDAGDEYATSELASLIAAAGISVTRNPVHETELAIVAIGERGGVLPVALAAKRAADAVGLYLIYHTPQFPELAQLTTSPLTTAAALAAARALAARVGLRVVQCADQPGLLVGGLLYPHLRDAVAMVSDGYATPEDIDTAMRLGCGYERGPVQMLDGYGPLRASQVLAAMARSLGDLAFAPPRLLIDHARAGLRFLPAQSPQPPGQ
jgi:3-hydroxybutyryl-CoA dehydrogenase